MAAQSVRGSRFVVDLGDVKLPAVVEKQVEAEIRTVVLRTLAKIDEGGDGRLTKPVFEQLPGGTLGLWLDPDRTRAAGGPLTPGDHTLIMRAIMEHPLQVIRYLPDKSKAARPSQVEVLRAVLRVGDIDDYTKDRTRAVLDILPKLEEARATAPAPLLKALDGIRQQLAKKPVEEQRGVLRDKELRSRYREFGGLVEGMETADLMLEDGRGSIYSPDFGFYRLLTDDQGQTRATKRDVISDIGSADTIGATAGGAVGSIAGGIGAAPGAVAAGTGASAGAAVGHLIGWLLS